MAIHAIHGALAAATWAVKAAIALALLVAAALPARAQFNPYSMSPSVYSTHAYNYQSRQALERSRAKVFKPGSLDKSWSSSAGAFDPDGMSARGGSSRATAVPTTFKPVGGGTDVAARMAQSYPKESRAEAARVFRELLDGYHKIEQQFSIPRNDVAGAVAALLAGSYMAYHNADFPDRNFPPLVKQMRGVIADNPEFAAAGAAEKQEMYEQLAILGMLTASTQMALKQNPGTPNASRIEANLRQAGKDYLETFLKTDASRVQITSAGLALR